MPVRTKFARKPLGTVGFVRRLVLLLSAVVAVDTMFYTALAPLLPHFASRYGLTKSTAGAVRSFRDPHLLERRPAVRPAVAQERPRRVRAHERAVHLQPAPVRIAVVAPAALVAMDAKPLALVRRPGGKAHHPVRACPPEP